MTHARGKASRIECCARRRRTPKRRAATSLRYCPLEGRASCMDVMEGKTSWHRPSPLVCTAAKMASLVAPSGEPVVRRSQNARAASRHGPRSGLVIDRQDDNAPPAGSLLDAEGAITSRASRLRCRLDWRGRHTIVGAVMRSTYVCRWNTLIIKDGLAHDVRRRRHFGYAEPPFQTSRERPGASGCPPHFGNLFMICFVNSPKIDSVSVSDVG